MNVTVDRNIEGKKLASSIAMTMSLVTFAMLFATMFLGYTVFRMQQPVWPPMGMPRVGLTIPLLSTLLIVVSSFTYWKFEKNIETKKWLIITTLLGIGFLISQTILWNEFKELGLFANSGIFASILYAFTWLHAAHIVMGLCGLVFLLFKKELNDNHVINVGKFWHFLDIVWIIMLGILFIY